MFEIGFANIHIQTVYDLLLITYNFSLTNDIKCYFFHELYYFAYYTFQLILWRTTYFLFQLKTRNVSFLIHCIIQSSYVVILSLRLWVVHEFDSRTLFNPHILCKNSKTHLKTCSWVAYILTLSIKILKCCLCSAAYSIK